MSYKIYEIDAIISIWYAKYSKFVYINFDEVELPTPFSKWPGKKREKSIWLSNLQEIAALAHT